MNEKNTGEDTVQFELRGILSEISRNRYIIAAIMIVLIVLSVLYSKFLCVPMYTSCAKIYIFNSSSDRINTSEIAVATYLTKDYSELIVDRSVLNEVNKELGYNYSYESLKSSIKVNNPEDSRILEIYATDSQPVRARNIANKVCEVAQRKIVDLMGVDRVNIISEAYIPTQSSSPYMRNNLIYGIVIGIALSAFWIIVQYFRNDKISGEKDIEKHLGICVLGTIPYHRPERKPRESKRAVHGK